MNAERKVSLSIVAYSPSMKQIAQIGLHRPKQKPPKFGLMKPDFQQSCQGASKSEKTEHKDYFRTNATFIFWIAMLCQQAGFEQKFHKSVSEPLNYTSMISSFLSLKTVYQCGIDIVRCVQNSEIRQIWVSVWYFCVQTGIRSKIQRKQPEKEKWRFFHYSRLEYAQAGASPKLYTNFWCHVVLFLFVLEVSLFATKQDMPSSIITGKLGITRMNWYFEGK